MKKLELSIIRLDGDTQVRNKLDQGTVNGYADLIADGVEFPPVTVYYDGSDYWLSSGFHRYFAHKKAKRSEIDAEVVNGTLEDAKLYAIEANNKNGKPLTSAEKRGNVIRLLNMDISKDWSNAEIARHAGVSTMTVSRIRADRGRPEVVKYTTNAGVERTVKTAGVRTKTSKEGVEEAKEEEKFPKEEENSKKEEDKKFEEAASKFDERESYYKELETSNEILNEQVTKLKDIIAVQSWDATEFEKLDAEQTIAELRERIRILEIDNEALRISRDSFQRENAELIKINRSLQNKLKKAA